jgi:glutathione S-transferase
MKLVYFDCRGISETIRLILAYLDVEYTDYRYPLSVADLSQHKFVKPEFDKDKSDGLLIKSMNKVPYLQMDDGIVISQSKAIERYLARKYHLFGETDIESAQIDSICETVRDIKDSYKTLKREDKLTEWFSTTLIEKLNMLQHLFTENTEALVGDKITLADLVVYSLITEFFTNKEGAYLATESIQRIRGCVDTLNNHPAIQKWLTTRPVTDF